jgi:cytochrome c peroxidase
MLSTLALMFMATGCQPIAQPTTQTPQPSGTADKPAGDERAVAPFGSTARSGEADDQRTTTELATAPDSATNARATAPTDEQTKTVRLGDDILTAGIPGEGPLTIEQIKTWLDDPGNHQVIEPELPLGLSAAAANIQNVEQNPLTRAKIELGRQLYFDPRLSSDGTISCASCHHPDEGFARHTQFGVGVGGQEGNRNSPVSYNRIVSGVQFWDGRAASLEEQAGGPIANPIEMGNTHEKALETLRGIEGYRLQFDRIFPDEGITLDSLTRAIASFERAIVSLPAPYDYYEQVRTIEKTYADELEDLKQEDPELYAQYQDALAGSKNLSDSAKRGRELFFSDRAACTACHAGGNFTDEKYHNLGVGMNVANPDLGRYAVTNNEADKGAFKTPTVRNVALSAPYMHDGSQATLEEVVDWYVKGGHPNPHLSDKIKKLDLNDQEQKDLVAFMTEALTSPFPTIARGRLP